MTSIAFFRKSCGIFLAVTVMACTDHLEPQAELPVVLIQQSEPLTIPAAIDLPPNLPAGNARVATYFARGVQKYKAQEKAGSSPVAYEWVFVAPEADLFDATNAKIGTHFAGPSWKLATTGDLMVGQAFSPAKTASQDVNSIDWLLLMPKSGTSPSGIFQEVDYIQRIATRGGKAPATPPVNAQETADVPYTAIYRFSKSNP
ncbi:DUF3455 domain-containing protein [Larkinella bovis]|uniref:DUF3455 domain-containing protein n=1 Tax=Larkinella bovis TaxID=683041 RepID=A0ABW0I909_9BACT